MTTKIVILCLLGILIFFPTFKAPFCFDDSIVIVQNPLIQNLSQGLSGIRDVWNFQHSRFLTNLTLAVNFYLHQFNTVGYHIVNFLIHLLTSLGIWVLVKIINPKATQAAFWAAALFLVHPVNTEAVSYISQRSSSLVALFFIWSVICYMKNRIILCLLLAVLAILSRETALVLPLAWVLVDYFLLKRRTPHWVWGSFVIMLFTVIIFFDFRFSEILFTSTHSQSHYGDFLTPTNYLLTQLKVLVTFLKLIFFPVGLNLDYDFPMSQSLWEWETFSCFITLIGLLVFAYKIRRTYPYFSFIIFWFFVSLLTHILPVRGNVIAEHKLYLTLSLLVPVGCYGLFKHLKPVIFQRSMLLIVVVFSALSFERNVQWSNPILLWERTVSQSPQKARPYINLGLAYQAKGQLDKALSHFDKAISLAPDMPQAYAQAAQILFNQNNITQAMNYMEAGIKANPKNSLIYLQRGVFWAKQNKFKEALKDIDQAIILNCPHKEVYKMREMLYAAVREEETLIRSSNTKHPPSK